LCDVNIIESVQRRFTKRLRGLRSLSCKSTSGAEHWFSRVAPFKNWPRYYV